tara:strand:- start:2319 stop:2564 length:246 start_codon:yes stop_codon:yes gene_type:complete
VPEALFKLLWADLNAAFKPAHAGDVVLKVRQLGKQAVDFALGDVSAEFGQNDVTDHGGSYGIMKKGHSPRILLIGAAKVSA